MKKWSKKKTIITALLAFIVSIAVGTGAYAFTQHYLTGGFAKQTTYTDRPSSKAKSTTPTVEPPQVREYTAEDVILGVNQERVKAGLSELAVNPLLNQSACLKADDMVEKNYWAHDSPDGTKPWHWFNVAGYDHANAGENLGEGYYTPDAIVTAWMRSEGHKANIVGNYTEMGMCIRYETGMFNKRVPVVVNHFATPR